MISPRGSPVGIGLAQAVWTPPATAAHWVAALATLVAADRPAAVQTPTDRVTPHYPTTAAAAYIVIVVDIDPGVEDVHVSAVPVKEGGRAKDLLESLAHGTVTAAVRGACNNKGKVVNSFRIEVNNLGCIIVRYFSVQETFRESVRPYETEERESVRSSDSLPNRPCNTEFDLPTSVADQSSERE